MKKLIYTLSLILAGTCTINQAIAASKLESVLNKHEASFGLVLPSKYQKGKIHVLDLSKSNAEFAKVNIYSSKALIEHSKAIRKQMQADLVIGRYLEDRNIYKRGDHYQAKNESRSVHLGQDLMVPAGTVVYAPLDGKIHSFKDNNIAADYGPTIILEHQLDGVTFYTLYGHLSRESLKSLKDGQSIKKHQKIATVGKPSVNGGWPEHLHFQIIDNMQNEYGNFKGVIEPSKTKEYALHCPNPNLILNIPALKIN